MWGLVAAILLVIILVFLWRRRGDRRRTVPDCISELEGSSGALDEVAKKVVDRPAKNSRDRFSRGYAVHKYMPVEGGERAPAARGQIAADYMMAMQLAEELELEDRQFAAGVVADFGRAADMPALVAAGRQVGATAARERRQKALSEAAVAGLGRAEATVATIKSAVAMPSDPQNVHDSAINTAARQQVQILRGMYGGDDYLEEACDWGRVSDEAARRKTAALISANHYVGSYGASERDIFNYVCARAYASENADCSDDIKSAIGTAMGEAATVCIQGRCARYLGALAAIDADPRLGELVSVAAYRAEIFKRAAAAADDEFTADPDGADDYDGEGGAALREKIKERIEAVCAEYRDRIPASEIDRAREEVFIYAGLVM